MHTHTSPAVVLLALAVMVPLAACSVRTSVTPGPEGAPALPSTAPSAASSVAPGQPTPSSVALASGGSASTVVGARPAPPLAGLVNPDGSAFDLASYAGSPTLLFFGYSHCPDVCPATIGEIFGVFEAEPATRAVFVSIDPERDTPEFLAEWTRYFPENFDAVTGSPGAIRRAADGYGVRYARVETTSRAGYTMSHTADLFLIDPQGQLRLAYPFGTPATTIVEDLARLEAG